MTFRLDENATSAFLLKDRGWVRKFCHMCYITINRHDRLLNYTDIVRKGNISPL